MSNKLILGLLLAFAVSCSSSSGDDDDAVTGPVIDNFSAPATATLQTDSATGQQGWPLPMTFSFHDDTENVTGISFSASGATTQTLHIDPTKQATSQTYPLLLLYTPNGTDSFKAGTTVDYAVSLVSASGAYGKAATGTIALQ